MSKRKNSLTTNDTDEWFIPMRHVLIETRKLYSHTQISINNLKNGLSMNW